MRIVIFQGGLGNQIFQYYFYLYVKNKIDKDVKYLYRGYSHTGFMLSNYFDVELTPAPKIYKYIMNILDKLDRLGLSPLYIKEISENNPKHKLYFDGYWQDKKYFSNISISFKLKLSKRNSETLSEILDSQSVAIHVRRGDYLLPQYKDIYGDICTFEYYNDAVKITCEKLYHPRFFVFSDDIEWVRHNFNHLNATFIDWNTNDDSIFDMYLMSKAKVNIIANSTFSFWSAMLNTEGLLTIYPQKWFKSKFKKPNIFPENWIGL